MRAPKHANLPAIFTSYVSGASLQELAETWDVPLATLQATAREQDWAALAARLPSAQARITSPSTERRMAAIEANRNKILRIYEALLTDAEQVAIQIRDNTLALEKLWQNKGEVIRAEHGPGLSDRQAFGSYLKTLQEIGCRALGDLSPSDLRSEGPDRSAISGGITIVLPGIVQVPPHVADKAKPVPVDTPTLDVESQRMPCEASTLTSAGARSAPESRASDLG